MSNPLLVICGPTATGKTELGLYLAKILKGEVISADSRQVYKYMDIGTGKGDEKVWGYDLVKPNEEYSVSHYLKFAKGKIKEVWARGHLPILVGGSGLYIKAVVDGIETIDIASDKTLRENLAGKSVEQLVGILRNADPQRFKQMNESDRKNPRRLTRAIEVASHKSKSDVQVQKNTQKTEKYNLLFVGLMTDKKTLKKRIEERVDLRVKKGFEKEVNFLKKKGYWDGVPGMTLGYREWPNISKWKAEEVKYAKRQMTWFRKDKRIVWFDINTPNYTKEVERLTKEWYSRTNA